MKFDKLNKSWDSAIAEIGMAKVINGALVLIIAALVFVMASQKEKIILDVETLGKSAWVTDQAASNSYKEAVGLSLALLMGNVTPSNVDFISSRLKPLLGPRIYGDVVDQLRLQSDSIKNDRVTIRFEAMEVQYEPASDRVFVYGTSFIKGSTGDEKRMERTYEYQIKISNYFVLVADMNTYAEKPHTIKAIEEAQKKEQQSRKTNVN